MRKIIFVCHGNICRSVAAEYIYQYLMAKRGIDVKDYVKSRATSLEEIGNDIYPKMKIALTKNHIPYSLHHAKRIDQTDYDWADYIFYMDDHNLYYLNHLLVDKDHKIYPINQFTSNVKEIEDPWYSDHFQLVVDELIQCINDIIEKLII